MGGAVCAGRGGAGRGVVFMFTFMFMFVFTLLVLRPGRPAGGGRNRLGSKASHG